jgi:hypothetical protein
MKTTYAEIATAAAVLPLSTAAGNAHAGPEYKSGKWSVYTIKSDLGTPLCGMHTDWSNATVYVKYIIGQGLVIDIGKNGWRFQRESILVPIQIGFDRKPDYLKGDADTSMYKGYGVLTTKLKTDEVALDFIDNFADANSMVITFGGNEGTWHADMTGSRNAAYVFKTCVVEILKRDTQPCDQPQAKDQPRVPIKPVPTVPVTVPKDDGSV